MFIVVYRTKMVNFGSVQLRAGKNTFSCFTAKGGLVNNDVCSILEDKKGILWVGTRETLKEKKTTIRCTKNMKNISILIFLLSSCVGVPRSLQKELQLQTIEKGSGAKVLSTSQLEIFETVTLKSGKLVYEHQPPKAALRINLGKNQLIKGLEYGLIGRREGEKFSMIIPVHLSQRKGYPDNTPRDSTLHYTVKVHKIIK